MVGRNIRGDFLEKYVNLSETLHRIVEGVFENLRDRSPAAIGFYPGNKQALSEMIRECYLSEFGPRSLPKVNLGGPRRIIACVSPHAGYYYSGPVAAHLYKAIAEDGKPESFVLMGPSHMGYPGASIMVEGNWIMPGGRVPVDTELAKAIISNAPIILDDARAHRDEHSLEVQLPFLQELYKDLKIVPIALGMSDWETCEEVGRGVAAAIKEEKANAIIIASTDLTHYGAMYGYAPAGTKPIEKIIKWVHDTDGEIISKIEALDAQGLLTLVRTKDLTMCGAAPVTSAIVAAKELGATKGIKLQYATSYDIRGSSDAIVGYLSAIMIK
ncbi:MAG: AmmeMemoRadiSam system protein B [Candidatus Freyarchaeota archaeon]